MTIKNNNLIVATMDHLIIDDLTPLHRLDESNHIKKIFIYLNLLIAIEWDSLVGEELQLHKEKLLQWG